MRQLIKIVQVIRARDANSPFLAALVTVAAVVISVEIFLRINIGWFQPYLAISTFDGEAKIVTDFYAEIANHGVRPEGRSRIDIFSSSNIGLGLGGFDYEVSKMLQQRVQRDVELKMWSTAAQSIAESLSIAKRLDIRPGDMVIVSVGLGRLSNDNFTDFFAAGLGLDPGAYYNRPTSRPWYGDLMMYRMRGFFARAVQTRWESDISFAYKFPMEMLRVPDPNPFALKEVMFAKVDRPDLANVWKMNLGLLREFVGYFRSMNVEIALIDDPEVRGLRPRREQKFEKTIRRFVQNNRIRRLNYRTDIDLTNEMFMDVSHLTSEGQEVFREWLLDQLSRSTFAAR